MRKDRENNNANYLALSKLEVLLGAYLTIFENLTQS